jgi:hypothetical protein
MNEAIIFHMDGKWLLFEGESVRAVQEYPRLEAPAMVLTDFGGALSGVSSVSGRSAYAGALIGRRLRDEGLVDGETRVLIHRRVKDSGGFLCLYTAVPMDAWRRMQSWAQNQKEHCLLIPQTAAMLRLLPREGNGLVFRCGRRISLLFQRRDGLDYFSALSLSDDRSDLLTCVGTLAARLPGQAFDPARNAANLSWFSLSGPGGADGEDDVLCAAFSEISGIETTCAPTESYRGASGECRVALSALRPIFSERLAINPMRARFDYFAEKRLAQAGWCAGIAALLFTIGGVALLWQASEINARAVQDKERAERAQAIAQSVQGEAPPAFPASRFHATRDLVDLIAGAQTGIDPSAFLRKLRLASGDKVKLLRVSVGKEIIVEGWVDQTGGNDGPLAGFVTQLRRQGFSPEAVDTSSTVNTRRTGFFAYRLSVSRNEGEGS